jgi:glucose-6-phosphate dehydrogenase assembly protein OpcA
MNPGAAESRLSAEVSARCTISFGRRQQICSEQIVITADGRSVDDVHGLVAPLLSSDLRTYLWWRRAGWPSGHSFDVLTDHCDRILLDSARFVSRATDLASLVSLIRKFNQRKPNPLPIGDLSWTRLGVWRTSLASLYDVPAYRDRLGRLTRVRITYSPSQVRGQAPEFGVQASASPPGDLAAPPSAEAPSAIAGSMPAEPLLIAGWLASRLGWTGPQKSAQPKTGRDCVFTFSSPAAAEMVLSPAPVIDAQAISEIQFNCAGDTPSTFSVRFKDFCLETNVVIEGQTQAGRVVACDDKPDGQLVAEELDILGNDIVYESAIQMASTLAALL